MEKLLKLLDSNARLTDAQLGVMLGCSEKEISEKIAEFERCGTIRGYKAVIDWDKTDRAYVTALIELRVSPKRDLGFEGIADTIMRFDEVESVYLVSGGYDLAVIVSGRTFKDIAMFVAKRLSTLDSVLSTSTHFVLRRYKDSGVIFLGEEKDERGVL
ncbi:MAG: Lrp/AsnC family transcriptional regulator [Oscillospiraceae bacterium]|nr:Lrp/AsnC family transcriptional regulator [Oscillospiraceae bacterium]